MLTMRPPRPWATMRRAAACPATKAPVRSVSRTSRHSSSPCSRNGVDAPVPALLTKQSRPSSASASSSTVPAIRSVSSRSRRRTSQRRPRPSTSAATSRAPSSSERYVMPTSQPRSASTTAPARPIPESPPVIRATGISGGLAQGHELAAQREVLQGPPLDGPQLLAAHAELALQLGQRQRLALLAVEAVAELDHLALAVGQLLDGGADRLPRQGDLDLLL